MADHGLALQPGGECGNLSTTPSALPRGGTADAGRGWVARAAGENRYAKWPLNES
jgi:hypothetical protein